MAEVYFDCLPVYEGASTVSKYGPSSASSPPSWYLSNSPIRVCAICGAPSNGFHFNAPSCSACAAFFRRTVTLDRKFSCTHQNNCRVNYSMRVICRACRYTKCIGHGMDRKAVQPRRDCNVGRRKISYAPYGREGIPPRLSPHIPPPTPTASAIPKNDMDDCHHPSVLHYASSYSSSNGGTDTDAALSPSLPPSYSSIGLSINGSDNDVLEVILREERKYNERRRILYATSHTVNSMLLNNALNDIPFASSDLRELTFLGIQKDSRSIIMLVYEWIKAMPGFCHLSMSDKKAFLCRALLYQCILDPAYITVRIGLPDRFVMFNGTYVGIDEEAEEGWRDEEGFITSKVKSSLYRPLLERVMGQIVRPLADLQLSFVEFVAFKALVSWKSTCVAEFSSAAKDNMQGQIDALFASLHHHYRGLGYDAPSIAERIGAVVLLMSSVVILESHQKIQLFDLWELDSLLLQLLCSGRV